jgi:hypothetical protein
MKVVQVGPLALLSPLHAMLAGAGASEEQGNLATSEEPHVEPATADEGEGSTKLTSPWPSCTQVYLSTEYTAQAFHRGIKRHSLQHFSLVLTFSVL